MTKKKARIKLTKLLLNQFPEPDLEPIASTKQGGVTKVGLYLLPDGAAELADKMLIRKALRKGTMTKEALSKMIHSIIGVSEYQALTLFDKWAYDGERLIQYPGYNRNWGEIGTFEIIEFLDNDSVRTADVLKITLDWFNLYDVDVPDEYVPVIGKRHAINVNSRYKNEEMRPNPDIRLYKPETIVSNNIMDMYNRYQHDTVNQIMTQMVTGIEKINNPVVDDIIEEAVLNGGISSASVTVENYLDLDKPEVIKAAQRETLKRVKHSYYKSMSKGKR